MTCVVKTARPHAALDRSGGALDVDGAGWAWAFPLVDQADPRQREVDQMLALDEVLTRLAAEDSIAAELVQLHTFGGLSIEEAGKHFGLSRTAAYRQWAFARAWLRYDLAEKDENLGQLPADGA